MLTSLPWCEHRLARASCVTSPLSFYSSWSVTTVIFLLLTYDNYDRPVGDVESLSPAVTLGHVMIMITKEDYMT